MKPKIGKCKDCNQQAPLIAGRCQTHYWQYRSKVKTERKPQQTSEAKTTNLELVNFFAESMKAQPLFCQECGEQLPNHGWLKKATVAHILPKRHFKSIATNKDNIIYLCLTCHSDYDCRGSEHVLKMKSFGLLKERFAKLEPLITDEERRHIPDYFQKNT